MSADTARVITLPAASSSSEARAGAMTWGSAPMACPSEFCLVWSVRVPQHPDDRPTQRRARRDREQQLRIGDRLPRPGRGGSQYGAEMELEAIEAGDLESIPKMLTLLNNHIDREENGLFPAALAYLDDTQWDIIQRPELMNGPEDRHRHPHPH